MVRVGARKEWARVRGASGRMLTVGTLVLAAGVAAAGCGILPAQGVTAQPLTVLPSPKTQQLSTVPVKQGSVVASVQVAGQIQPRQQALLYFTLSSGGKVQTMTLKNGATVRAGQVLATLDAGNLPFQISQQGLTIQSDQLQIQNLELGLQSQPPTSPKQAVQRDFQLQQAQVQLRQDQLALQHMQLQLAKYRIVAPFNGEISNVSVHLGNYVGAYQSLARISSTGSPLFVAKLPASAQTEVAPGQPVELTLAAHGQTKYLTTVNSVQIPTPAAAAIAQANHGFGGLSGPQVTLNTPKNFVFTPKDLGGAFTAIVTVAKRKNVLYLPNNGLVLDFQGLDYVNLDVSGRIVQRRVTLGLQGNQSVEVTGGLKAGDLVVQP